MQSYFPKHSILDKNKFKELNNKTFCMAPWVHLHVTPDGEVRPCVCYYGNSYGSLKKNSIEEIWNSDEIKKLRLNMINGNINYGCLSCYFYDKSNLLSERMFNNQNFCHHIDLVKNTKFDGSVDEIRFVHWNINTSNICNYKCRMCYQDNSTELQKESTGFYNFKKLDKKYYLNIIDNFMSKVEYIYFSGGEPLLIKDYYEILEKLIEINNTEITIDYNTNFTTLNPNIISLWKKFKNLQISVSIDGYGKRGEFIRNGFKWNQFLVNANQYYTNIVDKPLTALITVQVLNSFHVIDLHKKLYDNKIIKNIDHIILEFLSSPKEQSVWILPENLKQDLNLKIENHINNFIIPNGGKQSLKFFRSYQKYLFLNSTSHNIKEFKSRMLYLDLIRNENTKTIFPELNSLWE